MSVNQGRRAYLVGSGIASLSSAAYLIREGGFSGENIIIYDEAKQYGGSLDAGGSPQEGYSMRGGRMFEAKFNCTYDLLSFIPAISNPSKSAKDELMEFHQEFFWNDKARLVSGGHIEDVTDLGFSERDRIDLVKLCATPESLLEDKKITDCFHDHFFTTHFWFIWCTTFAFEPWHSAIEFKRYCLRFVHLFSTIDTMSGIYRTQFNQFDAMVKPLVGWLKEKGVTIQLESEITDVSIDQTGDNIFARSFTYQQNNTSHTITLNEKDLLFITNGTMTANSSTGSNETAPVLQREKTGGTWKLWQSLAAKSPVFGNPQPFCSSIDETKWESFTVTATDSTFFDLLEKFSGSKAGKGGLVTITDSNWLLTVVMNHQPHYYGQPDNVWVWWGYGLFPDKPGNFIQKKMSDCSGSEILTEVLSHLRFTEQIPHLLETSTTIPVMMPYITSQFMPRKTTDRPAVIPKGSINLAFIGQYAEIPDDVVFTVEYSVRTAQVAVFGLLGLDRKPSPFYKGQYDPKNLLDAFKIMHRK